MNCHNCHIYLNVFQKKDYSEFTNGSTKDVKLAKLNMCKWNHRKMFRIFSIPLGKLSVMNKRIYALHHFPPYVVTGETVYSECYGWGGDIFHVLGLMASRCDVICWPHTFQGEIRKIIYWNLFNFGHSLLIKSFSNFSMYLEL